MKEAREIPENTQSVRHDMETMRAAVLQAQQSHLSRGTPIAYLVDGVMHYELPNGELTRVNPWDSSSSEVSEE